MQRFSQICTGAFLSRQFSSSELTFDHSRDWCKTLLKKVAVWALHSRIAGLVAVVWGCQELTLIFDS
jgi:hypothetical protein